MPSSSRLCSSDDSLSDFSSSVVWILKWHRKKTTLDIQFCKDGCLWVARQIKGHVFSMVQYFFIPISSLTQLMTFLHVTSFYPHALSWESTNHRDFSDMALNIELTNFVKCRSRLYSPTRIDRKFDLELNNLNTGRQVNGTSTPGKIEWSQWKTEKRYGWSKYRIQNCG